MSDTKVYEPYIRARLGIASRNCAVVVLKSRIVPSGASVGRTNTSRPTSSSTATTLAPRSSPLNHQTSGVRPWHIVSPPTLQTHGVAHQLAGFISQKVLIKFFCTSEFPHKSVNLFFTSVMLKDKLTDFYWNWLLRNDFINTSCEIKPERVKPDDRV